MSKAYPNICGSNRKPNKDLDGSINYGKPCVVCGTGTIGEKWVQFNYFRGEDELIRVCAAHWSEKDSFILQKMYESNKPKELKANVLSMDDKTTIKLQYIEIERLRASMAIYAREMLGNMDFEDDEEVVQYFKGFLLQETK